MTSFGEVMIGRNMYTGDSSNLEPNYGTPSAPTLYGWAAARGF